MEKNNLLYSETLVGMLQNNYKNMNQLQLDKSHGCNLRKFQKLYEQRTQINHMDYGALYKLMKSMFLEEPEEIKKPALSGDMSAKWNAVNNYKAMASEVLNDYIRRAHNDLTEIKKYFDERKAQLAVEHKQHRKQHAVEKISCPVCGKEGISRTNITTHQRTKYCQEVRNGSMLESK